MSMRNTQQSNTTRTRTLREVLAIGMSIEAGKRERNITFLGPGGDTDSDDDGVVEFRLEDLESLTREDLDKELEAVDRMMDMYKQVADLEPDIANWEGILFQLLKVQGPVTEQSHPPYPSEWYVFPQRKDLQGLCAACLAGGVPRL